MKPPKSSKPSREKRPPKVRVPAVNETVYACSSCDADLDAEGFCATCSAVVDPKTGDASPVTSPPVASSLVAARARFAKLLGLAPTATSDEIVTAADARSGVLLRRTDVQGVLKMLGLDKVFRD